MTSGREENQHSDYPDLIVLMLTDSHSGLRWWQQNVLSCPVVLTHRDMEKMSCACVEEGDGCSGRGLE